MKIARNVDFSTIPDYHEAEKEGFEVSPDPKNALRKGFPDVTAENWNQFWNQTAFGDKVYISENLKFACRII